MRSSPPVCAKWKGGTNATFHCEGITNEASVMRNDIHILQLEDLKTDAVKIAGYVEIPMM